MEENKIDDENYMTQYEKQVVIDQEIAKLLADLPDYRKEQPSDKYSLEPITEREQGKFIHGQKWPIEPTEPTKLKSASRRPIRSTIKPIKPKLPKSMMMEGVVMEYSNGELIETDIFSNQVEDILVPLPGIPNQLRVSAVKIRSMLKDAMSDGSTGYVSGDEGNEVFKVAFEIYPQLLLDSNEATLC